MFAEVPGYIFRQGKLASHEQRVVEEPEKSRKDNGTVVLDASDAPAKLQRMAAVDPGEAILEDKCVLLGIRTLAIPADIETSLNTDIRHIVDKRCSRDANLREAKWHRLRDVDIGAVEAKLRLVHPAGVENISVGQRKISELVRLILRRPGKRVSKKVRLRQGDCLLAVGEKETRVNFTFLGLQKIQVGYELVFVESTRGAER